MTEKQKELLADLRNHLRTSKFADFDAAMKKNRSKIFKFSRAQRADGKHLLNYQYKNSEGSIVKKMEVY